MAASASASVSDSSGPAARAAPIDDILTNISITSTAITRFIRSVRLAHTDLIPVSRELSDMRLVLELLRDEQDIPLLLQAQVLALLEDCGSILLSVRHVLERCLDATQWTATGKSNITGLRRTLEIFRRALGLVLEVVNLSTLPVDAPEAGDIENQIKDEVDRLRTEGALVEEIDEKAVPVLESYLNAIINCLQASESGSSPGSRDDRSEVTQDNSETTPSDSRGGGIEDGLEAVSINSKAVHQQRPEIGQQFTNAGPWYPSGNIVLPYYNPYPQSPAPGHPREQAQGPPRISQPQQAEPPMSPYHQGLQPPLPLQPQTAPHSPNLSQHMWNQQMGRHNSSPSARSNSLVSFDSRSHLSATPESQWSEPVRDSGYGYTYPTAPYHPSRDPSIGSLASVTSMGPPPSVGPSDSSPRSLFSIGRIPSSNGQLSSNHPHGDDSPGGSSSRKLSSAQSSIYQTPTREWPLGLSPSPASASTTTQLANMHMVSSSKLRLVDNRSAPTARPDPIDIVPARHLTESKGKPHDVFHIDCSPTSSFIATKHSNNHVKMWSIAKNAVHSTTKITSYFTPQARSREYFIRSHAILSESATLLAVTTHFGFNLEIHNFSKANSSSKKMQTIDDAHRWAASKRDAYQTNYAPLVVYRPKPNRIDKFFLARHPNAKKPFWEDPSSAIELERCGLPFVPKFPELAYSANSPFLIAAAGPRHELNPGGMSSNNNSGNNVILVAWQMTPVSENRLQARSPADTMSIHSNDSSSTYGDSRHAPYRYIVPDYPALQNALPAVLAAHGSLSVSIWIPATHQDIPLPGNKFRRTPVSAPERFVLVWDLPSNSTRIFGIPNVQSCVSPDCRFVAYCDTARSAFVIVDVGSAEEVWRWPPDPGGASPTSSGWASFNGQLENLSKVTVFEFSADSKMLVVGDTSGSLGVYQVKDEAPGHGPGGRYELPPTGPSPTLPQQPWHKGINELQ